MLLKLIKNLVIEFSGFEQKINPIISSSDLVGLAEP